MNQAYRNGQKLLRGAYTQYTPSGKALFERAGEYHKEPKLGDVVYFYSSRMGRVRHVGAVVSVKKMEQDIRLKLLRVIHLKVIYSIEMVDAWRRKDTVSHFQRLAGYIE